MANNIIDNEKASELFKNLKSYRKAVGWTQEDFAEKVGVTRQTVADIEKGKKTPSRTTALAIMHILSVAVIPLVLSTFGDNKLKNTLNEINEDILR